MTTSSTAVGPECLRLTEIIEEKLDILLASPKRSVLDERSISLCKELRALLLDAWKENSIWCVKNDIDSILWRVGFYLIIEDTRKTYKSRQRQYMSLPSNSAAIGRMSHELSNIRKNFILFLEESVEYYQKLMDNFSSWLEDNQLDSNFEQTLGSVDPLLLKVYSRRLIAMGDISRYRFLIEDSPSKMTWYSRTKLTYTLAHRIFPASGHALNQLAVLVSYDHDHLLAIYYYTLAICSPEPFSSASENCKLVCGKYATLGDSSSDAVAFNRHLLTYFCEETCYSDRSISFEPLVTHLLESFSARCEHLAASISASISSSRISQSTMKEKSFLVSAERALFAINHILPSLTFFLRVFILLKFRKNIERQDQDAISRPYFLFERLADTFFKSASFKSLLYIDKTDRLTLDQVFRHVQGLQGTDGALSTKIRERNSFPSKDISKKLATIAIFLPFVDLVKKCNVVSVSSVNDMIVDLKETVAIIGEGNTLSFLTQLDSHLNIQTNLTEIVGELKGIESLSFSFVDLCEKWLVDQKRKETNGVKESSITPSFALRPKPHRRGTNNKAGRQCFIHKDSQQKIETKDKRNNLTLEVQPNRCLEKQCQGNNSSGSNSNLFWLLPSFIKDDDAIGDIESKTSYLTNSLNHPQWWRELPSLPPQMPPNAPMNVAHHAWRSMQDHSSFSWVRPFHPS